MGIVIGVTAFFLVVIVGLIIYFYQREQRMLTRLEDMLEEASFGSFKDRVFDNSKLSSIESGLRRYLCDQELMREENERGKQQLQEELSDIAHQSETHIANIVLYAQLLGDWKERLSAEDQALMNEQLVIIEEQSEKLEFLMQSLMKLSRLETGIMSLYPEVQPLNAMLETIYTQYIAKAEKKNITFTVEKSEKVAYFDAKWTLEAIANIVDNAIKYTAEGGKVEVCVREYELFVCIGIKDNGMGIPEDDQAKIFTRFYRSKNATTSPGVGVGLYLAREVMRAEHGYIKVESRPEQGSHFFVCLSKSKETSQN